MLWPAVSLLALLLQSASAHNVVSLVGDGWTLSSPSLNVSVPARVPSVAHLDLYREQVIGDPYYGLNDFNLRWVVWNNWTYTSDPIQGLSPNTSTWLRFDGLDTFAAISFCNQHVANTNNQFRQWWYDVSEILSSCANQEDRVISLNFGSAPLIANATAREPNAQTWPASVQQVFEFPDRWFVRKEQSSFGWDWGPAFAPAGPWREVYVVQLNQTQIHVRNVDVDVYRQGQVNNLPPKQDTPWIVNASLDYIGSQPASPSMSYTLLDMSNKTVASGKLDNVNTTASSVTGAVTIARDLVDLWWPAQLGAQNLYYLDINVSTSDGQTLAAVSKRIGFRTIVLNLNPVSDEQKAKGIADGNNWHFEVNGREFYAKGSNFIPPDAFWPRVTPKRINKLFDTVIAGNQNMLRVWASGTYSPDFMYDLADEKGILLWSEFEFGDALYPVDADFLDNVYQEAEYQVRRVNHHPSLALWAGGNELENLELYLVNSSAPDQLAYYTAQYEKLFLDTLVPAVFRNSRSISYIPSSTTVGWQEFNYDSARPFVQRYSNLTKGSIYGDTDFYNYNPAVLYNDSVLPVGRFSNEFGYHSMPSIQSWRQQISERDLSFNSTVVTLRDHHPPPGGLNDSNFANANIGQGQMSMAAEMWYPTPNKTNSVANFSAQIFATQLFQADLYKFQIQFYRRGSGLPNRQLGSLYWQLEDIWVAPTWASVEYDGRWKVLHYTAKDIYEHVIVAPYHNITTGNLSAWVTSDLWETAKGTASFQWYDWSGNKLSIDTPSVDFEVGGLNTTKVLQANTTQILQTPENAVLQMRVEAQGVLPNSNATQTFTHENWFHPTALSTAKLVDPGLQISHNDSSKAFSVKATTGVAAWVWIDYPAGAVLHFDRNAFWLAPGEAREIGYTVQSDTTGGKWVDGVTVQSIWNLTLSE